VVTFSKPIYRSLPVIVTRASSDIKSLSDLKGKKVGSQSGAHLEIIVNCLNKKGYNIQHRSLSKTNEVMQDFISNGTDAFLIDSLPSKVLIAEHPDLKVVKITESEIEEIKPMFSSISDAMQICVAFPKGSDYVQKVDEILEEMHKDGTIKQLEDKWLNN